MNELRSINMIIQYKKGLVLITETIPSQSFSKIIKLFSEGKRIHDIRVYTPYLKELSDEYEVARNAFIAGDLEAVAKFFSRFSK